MMSAFAFSQDTDPAGALGKLLGALDRERRAQTRRLAQNEHNRIGLLVVHALVALVVPPLFVFNTFTGPTWKVISTWPGFPYTWVLPLWVGGIILLPATFARRQRWEMAGLALIYLWYAAMGIGFAAPTVMWAADAIRGIPTPGPRPSLYAPVIYLHLAVIMRVHLQTLWRFRREDRQNRAQRAMFLGSQT